MKVLVTGASGQLGRALLASAPKDVICIGLDRQALDLRDEAAIARCVGGHAPDWVINAAAYTQVDRAEAEEELALAINARAVAALARVLGEHGGRLVQLSTDFVFDGAAHRAWRPDAPRAPLSAYGRSKAAGEDAAGAEALVVRTSWLHAAGSANFVRTMLRLMRERDELRVVADQIGCPTWAPGLATTIWGLIAARARGVFHHCDAGVASWYDFAVAIEDEAVRAGLLSRRARIVPLPSSAYPAPAPRPAFSLLDCTATRALLGDEWVHWRHNLQRMLEEEKALG